METVRLGVHPQNLLVQVTSFIGRKQALDGVAQLVAAHQLVSLTGAGGTGKTRLALRVGADMLGRFEDGVWFVELEVIREPGRVAEAVAAALGLPGDPTRSFNAIVRDHCRERALVLILDSCELVVQSCAELAGDWLRACPELRILATSRQALGIAGEITYYVPSLSVPNPARLPALHELYSYEAVRLFLDRATAVQSDFGLNSSNARAVAQICYTLDGIPLAIELAAARVRTMQVDEIAARLDDRFALLTGASRAVLPRHLTLRAVIGFSHDLLDEQECTLLRRLSAYAGACTLAEAQAACSGVPVARGEMREVLARLNEKSLVVLDGRSEETRYRVLEPIRQYALRGE